MKIITHFFFFIISWILMFQEVITKVPNPYKVLGVPKDANDDQIKQGFKRRSKKYHPDKNKTDPKAKEKYEKVINAYQLLKDPQRRKMYDMTGDDNPNQQMGGGGFHGFNMGGMNMQDLFAGFGMGGMGGGRQQQRRQGQRTTYTFSFGGGQGMRFQF